MSSFNLSTSFCNGYNCNIVFRVKFKDNIHFIFQLNMQALVHLIAHHALVLFYIYIKQSSVGVL